MHEIEVHNKAERIRDVIRYIKRFKNAAVVIHIDDVVLDSPFFSSHIRDIALIHEAGLRIVIVPGARKRITEILRSANLEWKFQGETRITDAEAINYIKMAAFDVSNRIMTRLAAEKLTGLIGNWVRARSKGIINSIDYGSAGEIDKIQIDSIAEILNNDYLPILPCIGWSAAGKPYNVSSVQLATEVAIGLQADKLFFLTYNTRFATPEYTIPAEIGLSPEECIPAMDLEELDLFLSANNQLSKQKPDSPLQLLHTALRACKAGVSRVHILDGSIDGPIPCEIFSDLGSGTMIYKSDYGGIRPMIREDIPALLSLIRPFVDQGILLPRTEEELHTQLDDFIVYELDGAIRSSAALHIYPENQGEIAAVAVDKTCAHIGIGPKMISYLIDRARQQKLSSVFVLTTQTSDWFEQLGFVQDDISTLPEKRKKKWSPERKSRLLRKTF